MPGKNRIEARVGPGIENDSFVGEFYRISCSPPRKFSTNSRVGRRVTSIHTAHAMPILMLMFMPLARYLSTRIEVTQRGKLIETGETKEILRSSA